MTASSSSTETGPIFEAASSTKTIAETIVISSKVNNNNNNIRLRRCKSTSRAEDIVTENEKQRRAQPDKPIHKPRDSILSLTSGFQNFEGIFNWAILVLTMGGIRLSLENLNKYGVRVDPRKWISAIFGHVSENKPREYPFLYLLGYLYIIIGICFLIEKAMSKKVISRLVGYSVHVINLTIMIIVPVIVIRIKYEFVGPIKGTLAILFYLITFLKLCSYVQVNYWCYCVRKSPIGRPVGVKTNRTRNPSLAEYSVKSRLRLSKYRNKLLLESSESPSSYVSTGIVEYPNNLTIYDLFYFWVAPTLCYELNFPKMDRIRKVFLLRRLMEVIVGINVTFALIQQWMIPSVVNSLIPFTKMDIGNVMERCLKLAIPNHLIWLTWFYLVFHSMLNTLGEIIGFADRQFYRDWWNSVNIKTFWMTWNIPVHRWCVRHLFKPILYAGYSANTAKIMVFIFSAFFHEYLISAPLGVVKPYAFIGMIFQLPLFVISELIEKKFGPRFGNMIVWLSLILGQPMAILMYYHDFVINHYGRELLETFGKL